MSAPVTNYSTTDAVRACLGITDNEMSDADLDAMDLDVSVLAELEDWLPTHSVHWAASKGAAPTATEIAVGRRISLYVNWIGALHAIRAYLAVPHEISDGKAKISRFAKEGATLMEEKARRVSGKYKNEIQKLNGVTPSTATVMGLAKPSFDPITGVTT